jgi:NAD-dependent dihydropyrimidine dehydrogenase PreA subunit
MSPAKPKPIDPKSKTRRKPMDLSYAKVPQGQVYVIPERCKECRFCVEFCPQGMLAFSTEINAKGYHFPIISQGREKDCIHCGFCNLVCPEFAIFTEEVTTADTPVQEGLHEHAVSE